MTILRRTYSLERRLPLRWSALIVFGLSTLLWLTIGFILGLVGVGALLARLI